MFIVAYSFENDDLYMTIDDLSNLNVHRSLLCEVLLPDFESLVL